MRARGIIHAALFGSVARGEATAKSDIDILIELEPNSQIDLFAYAGIKRYVAGLFTGPVDVVDREGLRPYFRLTAIDDAIYAF